MHVLGLRQNTCTMGYKPYKIPVDPDHKLHEDDGDQLTDIEWYQRLAKKLIFLSLSRPDSMYAVGVIGQFIHTPTKTHLANRVP